MYRLVLTRYFFLSLPKIASRFSCPANHPSLLFLAPWLWLLQILWYTFDLIAHTAWFIKQLNSILRISRKNHKIAGRGGGGQVLWLYDHYGWSLSPQVSSTGLERKEFWMRNTTEVCWTSLRSSLVEMSCFLSEYSVGGCGIGRASFLVLHYWLSSKPCTWAVACGGHTVHILAVFHVKGKWNGTCD